MEKIKELYNKYKEILMYLIFGVLTTVVNIVSYFLLARILHIDTVVSTVIALILSILFAYITNKLFVFDSKTNTFKAFIVEMITFFLARVVSGALCDVGTFALMVKVFKINDIIAKVVTQIMVIIVNYIFSKLVIFRKKEEKN